MFGNNLLLASDEFFKKCFKLIACFITFVMVLSAGIASKGSLLVMTSQKRMVLQQNNGSLANEFRRSVAGWNWTLLFSFAVPHIFICLNSLRICLFGRKLWRRPRFVYFTVVGILESGQAIGVGLLFGFVLPRLPMLHGTLVTGCTFFMPAVLNFLSRKPEEPKLLKKLALDGMAILAQLSGCLHFIFFQNGIENSQRQAINWVLPTSLILISFGWWENYVDKDAPNWLARNLGRIKEERKETRHFTSIFVSLWRVCVFFGTVIFAEIGLFTEESDILHRIPASFFFAMKDGFNQFQQNLMMIDTFFFIFAVQLVSSLLFYWFGAFACKIGVQEIGFALPITLTTPFIIIALWILAYCGISDVFYNFLPNEDYFITHESFGSLCAILGLWLCWFLSQIWLTIHIWYPEENFSVASNSNLFVQPFYNPLLIEHSMSLNRVRYRVCENTGNPINDAIDRACSGVTRLFAVVTMWHETNDEMLTILKSIFRMDRDQSNRCIVCDLNKVIDPHVYDYETHIFFDDAFATHSKDGLSLRTLNTFANNFIELMRKMHLQWTNGKADLNSPTISVTPYGGRLVWILPGKTKMMVHLKDKTKIRNRKRWSQVMYISYLVTQHEMTDRSVMENTFLLTLDGDMDFRPKAAHILMDMMKTQRDLAVICNRNYPTGSAGSMVWYQMFEYALGFWLFKPSETVFGTTLCAPGCFSIIRASNLLDHEVMNKFTARSEKAHHFVQRDQGEDRWLCTLLIKRGYRIGYSASSFSYTRCPDTFNEFYNQRRRWSLSILSNTIDLLCNCRHIIKINPNISWFYIVFQASLLAMCLLGPGSVFLMLVNSSATAFRIDPWISVSVHSVPIFVFTIICFVAQSRIQLMVAKILSAFYGLVVAAVMINLVVTFATGIEVKLSLQNAFFIFLVGCVILAGFLHPREIYCLLAGPIFLLLTPSMSILLTLYSIINMNAVSWGTRDSSPQITESATTESPPSKELKNGFYNVFVISTNTEHQQYKSPADYTEKIPKTTDDKDYKGDSILPEWNVENEFLLHPQCGNVENLTEQEIFFWRKLIDQHLFPIEENDPERKARISADLSRLRNSLFTCFFAINAIFVAIIFGLQTDSSEAESQNFPRINSSDILVKSKMEISETSSERWFPNTSPLNMAMVSFACLIMVIQLVTTVIYRLNNLTRILSSTRLGFCRRGSNGTSTGGALSYKDSRQAENLYASNISIYRKNDYFVNVNQEVPIKDLVETTNDESCQVVSQL